jgi:RNA polymerase sigma factor (sigma-70 family)
LSDAELCQALSTGDAWAAEVIYDRVATSVDIVLCKLLGAGDNERDDLAQCVLERVISTIVTGRFSRRCSLRSWASLIAQNLAFDTMRSRSRERQFLDRSIKDDGIEDTTKDNRTPERIAEARRRVEWLLTALCTIDRRRAEAVVLHDILGHDLAEIACLTGASLVAVQSRLVRGRRELLRIINGKERNA